MYGMNFSYIIALVFKIFIKLYKIGTLLCIMKNDKKHIHLVLIGKLNSLVVNFCEEFDIFKTEFFKLLIIKYFSEDDVEKT